MSPASGLLPSGWPDFGRRHWERAPAQSHLPVGCALPSGEQLMEVVREATRGNAASRVRVFTANPVPFTDARQFDPTGSDSNLESYLIRAA